MNPSQMQVNTASQQEDRETILLKSGRAALGRLARRWALDHDAAIRLVEGGEATGLNSRERLERLSHILGIYRAATALFKHRDVGLSQWLRAANTAAPFAGSSPLDAILDGRNLDEVRGYLECQLVA